MGRIDFTETEPKHVVSLSIPTGSEGIVIEATLNLFYSSSVHEDKEIALFVVGMGDMTGRPGTWEVCALGSRNKKFIMEYDGYPPKRKVEENRPVSRSPEFLKEGINTIPFKLTIEYDGSVKFLFRNNVFDGKSILSPGNNPMRISFGADLNSPFLSPFGSSITWPEGFNAIHRLEDDGTPDIPDVPPVDPEVPKDLKENLESIVRQLNSIIGDL